MDEVKAEMIKDLRDNKRRVGEESIQPNAMDNLEQLKVNERSTRTAAFKVNDYSLESTTQLPNEDS